MHFGQQTASGLMPLLAQLIQTLNIAYTPPRTKYELIQHLILRIRPVARWQHINSIQCVPWQLPIQSGLWSGRGRIQWASVGQWAHAVTFCMRFTASGMNCLPHFIAQCQCCSKSSDSGGNGRCSPKLFGQEKCHLPPLCHASALHAACLRHITPQFNYDLVFEFIMPLSKRGRLSLSL